MYNSFLNFRLSLSSTTAKVHPKSLLPSWRSGAGLRSKLVDFAITLKPDPLLKHSYPNLEPLEEGLARSFNSTCLNTVLQEPIAISIEPKTEDGHNNEAIMQLFTWSIAHLERLRILMQESGLEDAVLPALPLLSVNE
ncbi:hypothetical protein PRZ48_006768 [Zasmidium cellare]|uniref:PD-(D/E)XK nuclease-like domain-containing protein n=1 Tax=Zasmidium cellare TaxID=395010 RepID=A0ABR0EHH6_ZASCE|nr:hypothetical protein PRZ48_006768 [Zasmidium cellare]